MPKPPAILTSDGKNITGQTLVLTRAGLDLRLDLAADQELDGTSILSLDPAPGSESSVGMVTLSGTVSCDLGAFPNSSAVSWLLADWGSERPLASIQVQTATAAKARVKVFSNGGWSPLYPIDIIATGSVQGFNPVVAGKVLIELVTSGQYPGLWNPAPAVVIGLILKAVTLPGDLSLTVAGQAVGSRLSGLLPAAGAPVEGFAVATGRLACPALPGQRQTFICVAVQLPDQGHGNGRKLRLQTARQPRRKMQGHGTD